MGASHPTPTIFNNFIISIAVMLFNTELSWANSHKDFIPSKVVLAE